MLRSVRDSLDNFDGRLIVKRSIDHIARKISGRRDLLAEGQHSFRSRSFLLPFGVALLCLGGFPLPSVAVYALWGLDWPFLSSIVAGVLQVVVFVLAGRKEVYADWIFVGVLDVSIGVLLAVDPWLSSAVSMFSLCSLVAMSSLVRIGIGLTSERGDAFVWLGMSGVAGLWLLLGLVLIVNFADFSYLERPLVVDAALRVDLLLRGAAIIGFALSLKNREE